MSETKNKNVHLWRRYEVWLWSSRNNFISSIPVYLQLTERYHSKYSPWAAMHLAQWCCCFWKHYWNSCCRIAFSIVITFLLCFQYPKIFIALRQTSFLETVRSHSEPHQEWGGHSISVLNLQARNSLTESALWVGALSWWRIQLLGQSPGLFQFLYLNLVAQP
jgi:hypothetical protein